jgi:hypothetical protein
MLAGWFVEITKARTEYEMGEAVCGGRDVDLGGVGGGAAGDECAGSRCRTTHGDDPQFPGRIRAEGLVLRSSRGRIRFSQSLYAFNALAEANGFPERKLSDADIQVMTREERIPAALAAEAGEDPERRRTVLFRRAAGPVRITIFEGRHEAEMGAALNWLARQKKGSPACFDVPRSDIRVPAGTNAVENVAR